MSNAPVKTEAEPAITKKLRVGWFSFSCCEDSTIVMTELLNDRWQVWKKYIDFRHARVLQSKNVMDAMDVAFVEGAIANKDQEAEVKKIRDLATTVIAVGSCACTGMPSGHRNTFDEATRQEIKEIIEQNGKKRVYIFPILCHNCS